MVTNYRRLGISPTDYSASGNTGLSFTLMGSGFKWAAAFIPNQAFNLAKVAVFLNSETGTSPEYQIRIEGDNGAGRPSGTLAWTNATANFTATASGWTSLLSLVAAGDVTPGVIYHMVVEPTGSPGAPDASNNISIRENGMMGIPSAVVNNGAGGYLPCYSSRNSGASWGNGGGSPVFVLSNSDSSVMVGQVMSAQNIYTITNTNWKGMKFVSPVTATVWGAAITKLNSTVAGSVSCFLIDATNTILATGTVPGGWWDVQVNRVWDIFVFDASANITQGSTYRLVWKDPNGVQRFDGIQCVSSTFKSAKPGTDQYILTEGTSSDGTASPTSWTDSDDEEVKFDLFASSVPDDVLPAPVADSIFVGGGIF